jgi:energy-converting hydrogenase Eha subunit F
MRTIVSVSASLAALALLAACGSRQPAPPQVIIVPQPAPSAQSSTPAAPSPQNVAGVPKAKPGFGRVETVTVMPTASAGGTAPNMMSRISIKMEDGTTQYVDTSVSGLAPGDRVEITNEGYLKR